MKRTLLIVFLLINILYCYSQNNNIIAYNNIEHINIVEHFKDKTLVSDIYDDWETMYVKSKVQNIPVKFNIDLTNFCMPIDQKIITSKYGKRWNRQHHGVDIKAYHGDSIRCAFSGKVRVVKYDPNGYGNVIVIRHSNGLETVYGHLSKQLVKTNQIVKVGDVIGLAGNTGRSTGTHLHFETRCCGISINPEHLFDFKNQDILNDNYIFN